MMFFVNLQVSDPYRRTDFTLELEILIFVHSEMNFDLHMGLKMEMGEGGAKQKNLLWREYGYFLELYNEW